MRKPREDSKVFIEDRLSSHSKVSSIEQLSENFYLLERTNDLRDIYLLVVDEYTIGITNFIEAKTNYPNMNALMTISSWNGYTRSVKSYAIEEDIGIFVFRELLGALNIDEFWNYIKRNDDGGPIFFGGRSG